EEHDIPYRAFADAAIVGNKQGVIVSGLLRQPPIVEKWKCTHMLDHRQVALVAKGFQPQRRCRWRCRGGGAYQDVDVCRRSHARSVEGARKHIDAQRLW